jgi:hypothetical protein
MVKIILNGRSTIQIHLGFDKKISKCWSWPREFTDGRWLGRLNWRSVSSHQQNCRMVMVRLENLVKCFVRQQKSLMIDGQVGCFSKVFAWQEESSMSMIDDQVGQLMRCLGHPREIVDH